MDETGDQFANNITEDMKSLDINSNDSDIMDIIEEIKDKCESIVNDNHCIDESSDTLPEGLLAKRDNDSEADIEEEDNKVFSGDKDERKEQWINESDEPIDDRIKVSVVTTEGNGEKTPTTKLTLHPQRNRHLKPRTEKWGESVGIVDENGRNRRVIALTELSNYMVLEVWGQKTDSKIYCSLINDRYPRFLDSTVDYLQRWRMRYNIFVDKVLADKSDPSLVHLGELHLYFDLIPKFRTPYYVNNSFYTNPSDAEKELDSDAIQRIRKVFDSLRKSQTVFQLKFPIRGYLFHKTNNIYEKFNERQNEMMEEARAVYRKGIIRQRPKTDGPPIERTNTRAQTRPPMNRSQQEFGQSSRHYQPMGRQMPRRDRKPNERGQGLPPKARNEPEFDEMQKSFGQNNRDFNRRGVRSGSFRGNNRKSFNSKTNFSEDNRRKPIDDIESDVMFEDTREKHERSGGKPSGKSRRGGMNRNENRVGDKHMNAFRDRRDSDPKERSEFRQQNKDVLREDFAAHQIPSVYASNTTSGPFYSASDMDNNRRPCGQPYGRYNSSL